MSLRARRDLVRIAEADCAVRRAAIGASWRGFKTEVGTVATPGRVVVAGLVGGFLAGLPRLGGELPGSLLGSKLLNMLIDGAFANIGAAVAAGVAMAEAEDTPASAQPSATTDHSGHHT